MTLELGKRVDRVLRRGRSGKPRKPWSRSFVEDLHIRNGHVCFGGNEAFFLRPNMDTSRSLKPAVFHILLALADGDRHGYAIMQSVREQSGGRVPLQTGSLYRHLSKLIDQGLVDEAPEPSEVEDARRGTHYRLTAPGRDVLEQESRHLARLMVRLRKLRLLPREDAL